MSDRDFGSVSWMRKPVLNQAQGFVGVLAPADSESSLPPAPP